MVRSLTSGCVQQLRAHFTHQGQLSGVVHRRPLEAQRLVQLRGRRSRENQTVLEKLRAFWRVWAFWRVMCV